MSELHASKDSDSLSVETLVKILALHCTSTYVKQAHYEYGYERKYECECECEDEYEYAYASECEDGYEYKGVPPSRAGDELLQLYMHHKTGAEPGMGPPDAKQLASVASQYSACQDWEAAMGIAHQITAPQQAADVVVGILDGLQASGSSVGVASSGLPILHAAHYCQQVVRVSISIRDCCC